MKKLDTLKKQVRENYKASTGKEKHLITLERSAFKKTLSTKQGFGTQDMKPMYLELYIFLLKKYGTKLIVKPISMLHSEFSIKLTTTA